MEEEEELEMFDESLALLVSAALTFRAAAKTGGAARSRHGEHELHPSTLRAAERGRASAADHG